MKTIVGVNSGAEPNKGGMNFVSMKARIGREFEQSSVPNTVDS